MWWNLPEASPHRFVFVPQQSFPSTMNLRSANVKKPVRGLVWGCLGQRFTHSRVEDPGNRTRARDHEIVAESVVVQALDHDT